MYMKVYEYGGLQKDLHTITQSHRTNSTLICRGYNCTEVLVIPVQMTWAGIGQSIVCIE